MLALAAACAAGPAAAQFNPFEAIFGPFRPPADVPGRGQRPDRLPPGPPPSQQYPQQYPQYPPDSQYPPSARLPPGPPPGVQRGDSLPPPPGLAPDASQQGALPRPIQPRQSRVAPGDLPPPPPPNEIVTPPPQKIPNPTAVFSGLDKITGRIISFDVALNETVQFGALQVTPRACYTRPPSETQTTDAFLEVDEVTLQGEVKRIFTGWMYAASPSLHAVEHPIYDVWLVDCKGGSTVVAESPAESGDQAPAAQPAVPAQRPPAQRQQRPRQPPPPVDQQGLPVIR
jgi:hypothetical protein